MQLSVSDAARLLDTTPDRIYEWISEGSIPYYRVSDQYRFHRAELLEWATAHGRHVSVEIFHALAGNGIPEHPLVEALRAGGIHRDIAAEDRASAIRTIVGFLPMPDEEEREFLVELLIGRDDSVARSTIGDGIAIPHVRHPIVLHGCRSAISLSFLDRPLDFSAIDGKPVHTIFMMVTPTPKAHLHLLSRLSSGLVDPELKAAILRRASNEEIFAHAARVEASFTKKR